MTDIDEAVRLAQDVVEHVNGLVAYLRPGYARKQETIIARALLHLAAEVGTFKARLAEVERDEYARGLTKAVAILKARRAHYERYRDGVEMKTKPEVFAIIGELLVFIEAEHERTTESK